jgi:type IX secretion system PorP/SprF family membrane protein
LGIAAGISQIKLDPSKIRLENSNDPALANSSQSKLKPDIGAGIWLYGVDFFAGLSVQQLMGGELSFADNSTSAINPGKLVPHLLATAGYKFFLGEDIAAIPSVMLKVVSPVPVAADFNCKLAFQDKFWIGAGYRNDDSYSAMAGFNIGYLFNLSYSYDFNSSGLQAVSNGSHEVVLGLMLITGTR